jgi:hypothetical protein
MSHKKNNVNYEKVTIDTSKSPADYSYAERRAAILQELLKAGHPGLVANKDLAERFKVSRSTISHDFAQISKFLDDHFADGFWAQARMVLSAGLQRLVEQEHWSEARRYLLAWSKLIARRAGIETPDDDEPSQDEKIRVNINPVK